MVDDIVVNSTMGISHQEAFNVKVFPNPVSETVFVEAGEIITNLEIVDPAGHSLIYQAFENRNASLDISELANGIYFLKLTTVKGLAVKKILKK